MTNTAYKYRLYPTPEQKAQLLQAMGSTRYVWNYFLGLQVKEYEQTKKFIFYKSPGGMSKQLTGLKKELTWLNEPSALALQNTLIDLEKALRAVYKSGFGFPKFKSRKQDTGFRIDQINGHIAFGKEKIKVPKIGWIACRLHRHAEGKLKSITITRKNDKFYVSCLMEVQDVPQITPTSSVGIDLGIKVFATLSDGTSLNLPSQSRLTKRIKRLQRKLAKKTNKKSNRRNKCRLALANLLNKKARVQRDALHKWTSGITNQFDIVGLEDLSIKNMKIKGAQTLGLREFRSMIEYKAARKGKLCWVVDKWYPSSQLCHICGNRQKISLSTRTYKCSSCGLVMDRDLNAAKNIEREARNPAVPVSQSTAGTAGTRKGASLLPNAQGDMETEGQCRHIAGLEEDCSSNMEITFGISLSCEKEPTGRLRPDREATDSLESW